MACQVSDDGVEPGLCGPDGILASPNVKTVLCLAVVLQIMYVGFEEVYPLWALSTPAIGGLGWGSMKIGKALIMAGLALTVSQLVPIPYVIKTFGAVTWQRMACLLSVPAFLSIPCAKFLRWNAPSLFVVSVSSITFVSYGMTSLSTTLIVASTSMVPANMRAKLGGLFPMAESVGRILGPPAYATTFAWSISPSASEWADCHFIFYASAITMLMVIAVGWKSLALERLIRSGNGGYAGVAVGLEDKKHNQSGSASVVHHAGGNEVNLV